MFEIIFSIILSFSSFTIGYLIKYQKKYHLIAGFNDLKNKKNFTKNQIAYANRVAFGCFVFGVFLIGLTLLDNTFDIFPKQIIDLDLLFLLLSSLTAAFIASFVYKTFQ